MKKLTLLLFVLIICAAGSVDAQTLTPHRNAQRGQRAFDADPIRQLNLTPEQRDQIRQIREQNRDERSSVSQRLRETNRALEDLLDSDQPDEALVEQRLNDVAALQAKALRMKILSEVRIRKVLTAEQRVLLKSMRHRADAFRQERRIENIDQRRLRIQQRQEMRERRKVGPSSARPTPPGQIF